MSTCKECIDLLLLYVEGELVDDVRVRLEEHFSDCSPCETFLKTYKRTPGLCREALAAEIPGDVARKLRGFLRKEIEKSEEADQTPSSEPTRDVKL